MASKLFTFFVSLLVLFCFFLMKDTSGCSHACSYPNGLSPKIIQNRKMLFGLKDKKAMLKVGVQGSSTRMKYGEKEVIGELRKVPTGPDPLHHHSIGNPIKPETP